MMKRRKNRELRWLFAISRPYLGWMLAGILLATTVILANVALLAVSGWFITAMALSGLGAIVVNYFTPAAAIRGLAILRTAGRYFERIVTHEATFRLLAGLRQWFFERLEPLAPARIQHYQGGDLLSRISADIDSLENAYLRILTPTFAALLASFLMILFLWFWSPAIALTNLIGLLMVGLALPWAALYLGINSGRNIVKARAVLRQRISETVRGLAEITLYGNPQQRMITLQEENEALVIPQRQQNRIDASSTALTGLVSQFTWLVMIVIAIYLLQSGRLNGPELVMLAFFGMASFEAVATLPIAFRALGETWGAASRILDLVDAEPAVTDPRHPSAAPQQFDIRFEAVCFTYPQTKHPALHDISFCLKQGQKLAIQGASGSGKTSVTQLLLKFWAADSGQITIGGTGLEDLKGDTVRKLCAVVSQHVHLFNTTLAANLYLAKPDATDEEVREACRAAAILDDIQALPEGFNTEVGEAATRLSGGQIRRLGIARALLKDAPIVILDEPTEGLDAGTEQQVIQALAKLLQGRTAIIITHRPQLLTLADHHLLIDKGSIVP
ncbi:thiol reductant ABC exporter subunit CydC [Celerinatantimonas diazotrophica]|uniref:ATP-binding cassette subfamily C protein CydC n=1 Tax=Celerinatantimonas diazotrophica TaxID=412034 RepID=A0A4R1K3S7_9GAMM|nr:thiol reductant ABC exporter subunit CydC [Celerinatantimonas diazotrophica]TCK58755.1 ATP-binding cassette subfamily C protein CydC [Celerinatantimonas diazotrophica]CAG9297386.1 putative ABC transporter ATP-binding/permease protein [Celerinatantimonas diazotrophica]